MKTRSPSLPWIIPALVLSCGSLLTAAPMGAGYVLKSGPAGAVMENFDSMGSAGTSAPGMGEHTYWSINVANVERATNLFVANTFPANGAFNAGPWTDSGLTPESDRALGVYAGAAGDTTPDP